jgi:hypothetical protein
MLNSNPSTPKNHAGSIICIESLRTAVSPEPQPPQPAVAKRRNSSANAHRWTRRSFIRMFLVGAGIRKVAKFHGVDEAVVESTLRLHMKPLGEILRIEDRAA